MAAVPAELEVGVVVFGADLGAAHILELHDAVGAVLFLRMMFSNCFGIGEPADDAHGDLKVLLAVGRRPAELAGGNFDVLLRRVHW